LLLKLYRTLGAVSRAHAGSGCVATVGAYDGLHLGHQAIMQEVNNQAHRLGCPSAVMSFEPIPKEYFGASNPPARLARFYEKFRGLAALDIDAFFCARFDEQLRGLDPAQFIDQLLVNGLGVRQVVVGDDFKFAANRAGTIDDLRIAADQFGFGVTEVPSVVLDGERVSSTAIRNALASGDLAKARRMLGRDYVMSGRVVHGAQLGRTLGFPTANIKVKRLQCALKGVFAVQVSGVDGQLLDGVANLGTRPTVDGDGIPLLEVFIFDFNQDIYGRYIDVHFVSRMRDELKFPDLDSMIVQMHKDVSGAKEVLAQRRQQMQQTGS